MGQIKSQTQRRSDFCSDCKELIKLQSSSMLQLSTFSHVSFYINKSSFLSITPSPSLSLIHTHTEPVKGTWGWVDEGGRWVKHDTLNRNSVALDIASNSSLSILSQYSLFSRCFPPPPPNTICFQEYGSSQRNWGYYKFRLKTLLFVLEITCFLVNMSFPLAKRF